MPYQRSGRVNPDDLAKRVARHLADTDPGRIRFSLRDSVLIARLVSGVVALVALGLLVLAVFGGVSWLLGRPASEPAAEVVFDPTSFFAGSGSTTTTDPVGNEIAAVGWTPTTGPVPQAPTVPVKPSLLPVLPSPTTTSPVSTTVPVTTNPSIVTTSTMPGSTTSSPTTTSTTPTTTTTTTPTSTSTTSTTSTSSTTTTTSTSSTTTTTSTSSTTTTTTIPTTTTIGTTTTT